MTYTRQDFEENYGVQLGGTISDGNLEAAHIIPQSAIAWKRKAESRFSSSNLGGLTPIPFKVEFSLRGQSAGWAMGVDYLNFNLELAKRNLQAFCDDTIPHEIAHLIDTRLHGKSSHGSSWKWVMGVLGVNPSRCHNYDVSETKQRRFTQNGKINIKF